MLLKSKLNDLSPGALDRISDSTRQRLRYLTEQVARSQILLNDWKWELQSDRALLPQNPVRTQTLEELLCLSTSLSGARDELTNLTFTCTDFLALQSLESKIFRDFSK